MTVATGDTLATIAKNVYGDSALWYLIADANGLSGNSDLRVGQALSIPSRVGSGSNANTFTPYNASKVIGDTSPNLPQPAPRAQGGGGGCGGLGQILMIVVLVVVTVYTAGAMSGFVGSFSSTMSAGMGVLTGGAAGGAAGMAGAFGAAGSALGTVGTLAVASAAGSVASQLFGMAIGAQKDFSWNQVALAALGGAVSGGMMGSTPLGSMGGAAGDAAQVIARAAISSALNQGIAVVTGLQKDFSWSNVAFAAVGAGLSHAMNGALGLNAPTGGPSGFDRFALSTMSGFASGMTMNALRGGQMTAAQVATNAFGNALGNSIAEGMRPTQGVGAYSALDYRNGSDVESDNYAPPATSTPVAGPGNIVSTDLPPLAVETEVDNYDLQGKSRSVAVAGREGARGAWGIAESIAGKGASNADINRIKNQLLTLNPELADGVKLGQRYYMPDQDTAENVALARSADGVYAQQRSSATGSDGMRIGPIIERAQAMGIYSGDGSSTVSVEAKLLNDKNLMKTDGRSAYRTDSGYRDTKSGQYTKSPWTNPGESKPLSAESEYVLYGEKTSGTLFDALPIDNGNYADPRPFADYQGEGKVVLTGKNSLIPSSLDAKLSGGVRAGVRWAQGATEGSTGVLGATFGAKVEGNISTSAAAGGEIKASFKPGGQTGVVMDIGLSGNADAAAFRAQGKAEFPVQLGPLTLKPSVQVEGQALAVGVSGGVGFKTYETKTGGSMYISGGVAALFGAKAKFGLDWGWKN